MHNWRMSASIIKKRELTMNEIPFNLFKISKTDTYSPLHRSQSDDFVRFGYSIANFRTYERMIIIICCLIAMETHLRFYFQFRWCQIRCRLNRECDYTHFL